MRLLIVAADRDLVDLMAFSLRRAGFEVVVAHDLARARGLLSTQRPDLVILDTAIDGGGVHQLMEIVHSPGMPVIVLRERGSEEDRLQGFVLGASDALVKPFSLRELVARVRARLPGREEGDAPQPREPLAAGSLVLDAQRHEAKLRGQPLRLTVLEFRLLQLLMQHAGRPLPRETILRRVWGYSEPGATDVVRIAVYRLRRKIEADPLHPRLLRTVPRAGFMLDPQSRADADATQPEGSC